MTLKLTLKEQQNKNFFITFALLAKLSNIDGSVSKSEIDVIYELMDKTMSLTPKQREIAISIFNNEKKSGIGFTVMANEYKKLNQNNQELLTFLLDILFKVAMANNEFNVSEENFIIEIAKIFEITDADFLRIKSQYVKDSSTDIYYEILGCAPNTAIKEVETQYNALLKQYNVERMKMIGMPEEFVRVAEDKVSKFTEAFEKLTLHG